MRKMIGNRIMRKAAGAAAVMMAVTAMCGMTAWALSSADHHFSEEFVGHIGWYQDDNGKWQHWTNSVTYLFGGQSMCTDGWYWLDDDGDNIAECYYFDSEGYLVTDGTTPDGCTVNTDGQWVLDGIVMTQARDNSIYNGTYSCGEYYYDSDGNQVTAFGADEVYFEILENGDLHLTGYSDITGKDIDFTYTRAGDAAWIYRDDNTRIYCFFIDDTLIKETNLYDYSGVSIVNNVAFYTKQQD